MRWLCKNPADLALQYFQNNLNSLHCMYMLQSYEKEISSEHKNILHCVTLTLLTCLHHGDEHLAHDLLSTVVFSPALWR